MRHLQTVLLILSLCITSSLFAQMVQVGSGSYTKTFPGADVAGRNSYPSGTPQLSGNVVGKPVPTNDWWSKLIKENHADNLYNYPFAMKTIEKGLVVSYIPFGVMDDLIPITIGVTGLNATKVSVSNHSDWSVTMNWDDGSRQFDVTSGIGMPFLYINQKSGNTASVTINSGTVSVIDEMLVISNAKNGASFAVYAPKGSVWSVSGKVYTSTLSGKNYWSVAMLPQTETNITRIAEEYKAFAYVFPIATTATYTYNDATSVVRTVFNVTTEVKEGDKSNILQGLLPHQWNNLSSDSPQPQGYCYNSIRGTLKMLDGNQFIVENTFKGILPTLPYVNNYSKGFDPTSLNNKIEAIQYDGLATWTDSYNEGQVMNRLIQTARIADESGNIEARNMMLATVKERLENWLSYKTGEVAFLFYYNTTWSALLGYPAGHGQDSNLNDHHFHWGYFIHAAAFLEQYEPGWALKWGDMINLLVRDAASTDRQDPLFPYLRNFSPYAGHCWANGFATFPQGNDQESTSESMQFNSSLIHWGEITGNKVVRDLGIYLYTTEQTAIEEYWFDMNKRNFAPNHPYGIVSRVWSNGYDNGTFWTGDIAACYGIEMYPIHAGSLYLGHNTAYVTRLWEEMKKNTGVMRNEANVNLWHDVYWEYLSFIDPQGAIDLYDSFPTRELKFGISDAQTYQWLHAMNVLGQVDTSITANYPIAVAFNNKGEITYVAHNYTNKPLVVRFSTGYELQVPAASMADSRSAKVKGLLSSSFSQAYINGRVSLSVDITNGSPSRVVFYDGSTLLGEVNAAPYVYTASALAAGKHQFYARIYEGDLFNITNTATVTVGRKLPYGGIASAIPGIIESGKYDEFEGGNGQGVTYLDRTIPNLGDTRTNEYVDVVNTGSEGWTISNIAAGEWVEYTVQVASSGLYSCAFRYASANASGGGPFSMELNGEVVATDIKVNNTGKWDLFATKTIMNIPLVEGYNILRLCFTDGEFNLGKLTFTRTGDLPYSQPIAKTNGQIKVKLPANTAILDGSQSYDPMQKPLTYRWTQLYGPSTLLFESQNNKATAINNLQEGVYMVALTVSNSDGYSDTREQMVVVTALDNIPPTVAIITPVNNMSVIEGSKISISSIAGDLDGEIEIVEYFVDDRLIGSAIKSPFLVDYVVTLGTHSLKAKVTDKQGGTAVSSTISIQGTPAPSCEGMAESGDFKYQFSQEDSNPTLTFIPQNSSIGATTLILYYSTNPSGPMPGYLVKANQPYRINAQAGSTVYFYYTYSTSAGEKNNADSKINYLIGSCRNEETGMSDAFRTEEIQFFPNPVIDNLYLKIPADNAVVYLFDAMGKLMETYRLFESQAQIDMSRYFAGIYFVSVCYGNTVERLKVFKQ